jgi:V8-like Glu-specific endopeptidase
MVIMRVLAATAVTVGVALGAIALTADHPRAFGVGPAAYWTRARLIGSRPLRGRGYLRVPSPGQSRKAHPALLALRVGALFMRQGRTDHFCTASVVASPDRNLLITAAHCIYGAGGYRQDVVFIPDYRNGQAPFGIWSVKKLVVAPQWISDSDPNFDVGFVVLNSYGGFNVEDILGSNRLGVDTGYQYLVRVTGYPDGSGAPVTCREWTSLQSATQLRFDCDGFTGGTSGSPWVAHFDSLTRNGTIVGVIGGYQLGGVTSAISFSPLLGAAIEHLYQQAIKASVS